MDKNNLTNWYFKSWKIGKVSVFLTKEWRLFSKIHHKFDKVMKYFVKIGPIVLIWDK